MSRMQFSSMKHPLLHKFRNFRFSFILYILIFIVFLIWVSNIDHMTSDKELESLELALKHDIVHCYAVEGTYPPNLNYLIDHYGLTFDQSRFYIDYQPIGSNIYPDYEIIIVK